jgi:transposase-like protein
MSRLSPRAEENPIVDRPTGTDDDVKQGEAEHVERTNEGPEESPDPEVPEQPKRRRFTAKYKLDILRQADACKEKGELGRLLRREGLYSSHLTTWRRQLEDGSLKALAPKKRGRKPNPNRKSKREKQLEGEVRRLRKQLEQAETIIEIQKKVSTLLGIPLETPDSDENS